MTNINYEKLLLDMGLVATTNQGNQFAHNYGAMSHDFGVFSNGINMAHQAESSKLKCSTRTVSYSTLHVSTTTTA